MTTHQKGLDSMIIVGKTSGVLASKGTRLLLPNMLLSTRNGSFMGVQRRVFGVQLSSVSGIPLLK